jgi:hypothetical protein
MTVLMGSNVPTTHDHLLAFGSIVQDFARFERIVEICISKILSSDHALTTVAISNLGYNAKCEALKSLLYLTPWPDQDRADTVLKFISDFNIQAPLRNSIAHHVWTEGKRPGSIKPLSARSRGGRAKFQGMLNDERDYTADELYQIADSLVDIHEAFVKFLIAVGAMTAIDE